MILSFFIRLNEAIDRLIEKDIALLEVIETQEAIEKELA